MSWTGKYKLGVIARAGAGKYTLETRAGKSKVAVRVSKEKLGPGPVNTNWEPESVSAN